LIYSIESQCCDAGCPATTTTTTPCWEIKKRRRRIRSTIYIVKRIVVLSFNRTICRTVRKFAHQFYIGFSFFSILFEWDQRMTRSRDRSNFLYILLFLFPDTCLYLLSRASFESCFFSHSDLYLLMPFSKCHVLPIE
jgi:hypothetical protein